MKVVLAPHLDDEVIGCYSILNEVDHVVFCTNDARADGVTGLTQPSYSFCPAHQFSGHPVLRALRKADSLYLPSRYDYHPFHHVVRKAGLALVGQKRFYSVEMNVPWLEEEKNPLGKLALLRERYPSERLYENDEKYWRFCSIQAYDEVVWASVRFTVPLVHQWYGAPFSGIGAILQHPHRHRFHFQVDIQQYSDDRDIEYLQVQAELEGFVRSRNWDSGVSCEMLAREVKWYVETKNQQSRLVRVSVYEDGENGCVLEGP